MNWRRGGGKSGWFIEQWSAHGGRIQFLRQARGIRLSALLYDLGGKLSLQLHHKRSEHWVVVAGTALSHTG